MGEKKEREREKIKNKKAKAFIVTFLLFKRLKALSNI